MRFPPVAEDAAPVRSYGRCMLSRSLLVAAAAVVVLGACTSDDGATTATSAPRTTVAATTLPAPEAAASLTWGACESPEDARFQCATLEVPVDHDRPEGDQLPLALMRLPASGQREGAILLNPGGPGGSGVGFLRDASGTPLFGELSTSFDLVGFDPRGVGSSSPVVCADGEDKDALLSQDPTPATPQIAEANLAVLRDVWSGCQERYGEKLRFISTVQTARDIDAIRAAMGDERVGFYGISYGTYLGATYATLFPDRVAAMMLDSGFDPTDQDPVKVWMTQLVGFEDSFDRFVEWCEANEGCEFSGEDVSARWERLLAAVDASPLQAGDRTLGSGLFLTGTIAALYDRSGWGTLSSALVAVEAGDPSGMLGLADAYNGRQGDGTYSNELDSMTVIDCADGNGGAAADPAAAVAAILAAAPRFGQVVSVEALGFDGCGIVLRGGTPTPPPAFTYRGDGPIVVIGGQNDPATPFIWSETLAASLGATLVTYTGDGHGQSTGNRCLASLVSRFFLEDVVPTADTVCGPNVDVEAPSWWGEIPAPAGAEPLEIPRPNLIQLGLDPTNVFSTGFVTPQAPAAALDAFQAALAGWTVADDRTLEDGVRARTFERDGRLVAMLTVSAPYTTSRGLPPDQTILVIAGLDQ